MSGAIDGSRSQSSQWPVIGHEWAVSLLQNSLAAGRLPHALLFAGPSQVGKTTLALALASALNCLADERPCGQCRSCRKIAHGTHPDVRVVEAEAGKDGRQGILKIDQVRDMQRQASLAPMEGRYKIFLLRDLELANLPAANALLKTLEEPPPQVILLLTSARPHALLPTIMSRCQIIQLRPLPVDAVASALRQRWNADEERADLLARLSAGRLGWAVQSLTDEAAWEQRSRLLAEIQGLTGQGRVGRLAYAETLSRSADVILPTLASWSSWWRDILLIQQGCKSFIDNIDQFAFLEQQARSFAPDQVRSFLARLQAAPVQLSQNVNTRLLLETLLLHLPMQLT